MLSLFMVFSFIFIWFTEYALIYLSKTPSNTLTFRIELQSNTLGWIMGGNRTEPNLNWFHLTVADKVDITNGNCHKLSAYANHNQSNQKFCMYKLNVQKYFAKFQNLPNMKNVEWYLLVKQISCAAMDHRILNVLHTYWTGKTPKMIILEKNKIIFQKVKYTVHTP